MRYIIAIAMLVLAGCSTTPRYGGTVADAPDTSHTNSGGAVFGKDGKLHVRPAYVVDTMTPEQHAAARAGASAYFAKLNARKQAWLDAMPPEQRHAEICGEIESGIQMQLDSPGQTGTAELQYYLSAFDQNGCRQ